MAKKPPFSPFVSDNVVLRTFSVKALILGVLLSVVLAAANAYIGLMVGMTVSASIPAAAAAMGMFRLFRKSNILECNAVQTSASAGESLVAGVIFTLPALVMMGAWDTYSFGPIFAISVLGGIIGVAFTIPLRRALILDKGLAFPEGVATAAVLKTGGIERSPEKQEKDVGDSGFRWLVKAGLVGAIFKVGESGLRWFASEISAVQSFLSGKLLMSGGIILSPALIAIGFIVGPNIGSMVFLGGAIGTLIGVPLNWALNTDRLLIESGLNGVDFSTFSAENWTALAEASWQDCRRIGVGAMLVGGLWSLWILIMPVWRGIRESLRTHQNSKSGLANVPRTQRDIPFPTVVVIALVSLIPTYFVFVWGLQDFEGRFWLSGIMTIMVIVFGFIFSAVAGYIAGLVGSSNSPISGVTIATVVVSALVVLQLIGKEGPAAILGPMAVMYLAGFICCSASMAGDNIQDLQSGYLLGATPWIQQVFQFIGVVASAAVIPFTLLLLDQGQGIGREVREGIPYLAAPQASLMKDISTGIFGAGIQWAYIGIGALLAVLIIAIDEYQRIKGNAFRFPILAIAVGIYLPLSLSVPIFVGGMLIALLRKVVRKRDEEKVSFMERKSLIIASGIITGEALTGVLIAFTAVAAPSLLGSEISLSGWLGTAAIVAVIFYVSRNTLKADG